MVAHFVHEFWSCSNQTCLFVEPPSEPFNPPCGPSCLWPAKSEWQNWRMNKKKKGPQIHLPSAKTHQCPTSNSAKRAPEPKKWANVSHKTLFFQISTFFQGARKGPPKTWPKAFRIVKTICFWRPDKRTDSAGKAVVTFLRFPTPGFPREWCCFFEKV